MSKMSDLDLKIRLNPTLVRGLNALFDAKYPLGTVLSNPNAVLALPGVSVKLLAVLKQHALDIGYIHPLVALVKQLLNEEWDAGYKGRPVASSISAEELTKKLEEYP